MMYKDEEFESISRKLLTVISLYKDETQSWQIKEITSFLKRIFGEKEKRPSFFSYRCVKPLLVDTTGPAKTVMFNADGFCLDLYPVHGYGEPFYEFRGDPKNPVALTQKQLDEHFKRVAP